MEKMNQVSVSEFMSKSKEEMYDMAVEMVEKYNRLVDIWNDSAERIADKAAKIELLEKEIEGRKECYTALKELMDTKYISTEEHNNICEEFKNKIAELEEKVERQRENLNAINKTIEIKTKENYRLITVRNNLNKEIEDHESENARLEKLKKKEDDHGRAGFEEYIKYIIDKEETKFKAELNRKFSEEVSKISQKRTEEELAKVKLNEKFGVGGVPCGEDSIE